MPLSASPDFGLGDPLRPFRLPEPLTGRLVGPEDYPAAQALLVAFLGNGCAEVQHLAPALSALTRDLDPFGLRTLAVTPWPEDEPAEVAAEALRHGYVFPYLIDQTQAVARSYRTQCAPDFYLFDRQRRLAYHGRFDETRVGQGRAHGGELREAISRLLKGEPIPARQVAARGCPLWRRASTSDEQIAQSGHA